MFLPSSCPPRAALVSPPRGTGAPSARPSLAITAALLLGIGGLTSCGGEGDGGADLTCGGAAAYAAMGPYAVGVTRLDLDGAPVEVWYPADAASAEASPQDIYDLRDWVPAAYVDQIDASIDLTHPTLARRGAVASADGPFPVVLFSHGLGGYRMQSSELTVHLASWGYVVAAPEHPERNITRIINDEQIADNAPTTLAELLVALRDVHDVSGPLAGTMDFDRVAVSGHSQGGSAVAVRASDDEIDTWVNLASGITPLGSGKTGVILGGGLDAIATPTALESSHESYDGPDTELVLLDGVGHLGFSDLCTIGAAEGGILQVAVDSGLPINPVILDTGLATDGCQAEALAPGAGWSRIGHYFVGHLETVFRGADEAEVFGAAAVECFEGGATITQ
jgi:hypothetical protein